MVKHLLGEEFYEALRECDEARAEKIRKDYEANPPKRAFDEGETVKVDGRVGKVAYCYTNGFTMVNFGKAITGGIFNNDSTYRNEKITRVIK